MKAIMIVEVPDNCGNGDWYIIGDNLKIVYDDYGSLKNYKYIDDDMIELKLLPQKVEIDKKVFIDYGAILDKYAMNKGYQCGYNACIDEILGEEE